MVIQNITQRSKTLLDNIARLCLFSYSIVSCSLLAVRRVHLFDLAAFNLQQKCNFSSAFCGLKYRAQVIHCDHTKRVRKCNRDRCYYFHYHHRSRRKEEAQKCRLTRTYDDHKWWIVKSLATTILKHFSSRAYHFNDLCSCLFVLLLTSTRLNTCNHLRLFSWLLSLAPSHLHDDDDDLWHVSAIISSVVEYLRAMERLTRCSRVIVNVIV